MPPPHTLRTPSSLYQDQLWSPCPDTPLPAPSSCSLVWTRDHTESGSGFWLSPRWLDLVLFLSWVKSSGGFPLHVSWFRANSSSWPFMLTCALPAVFACWSWIELPKHGVRYLYIHCSFCLETSWIHLLHGSSPSLGDYKYILRNFCYTCMGDFWT